MDGNQMPCNNAATISLIGCLRYCHRSTQVISNLIYLVQKINQLPWSRKPQTWVAYTPQQAATGPALPVRNQTQVKLLTQSVLATAGRKDEERSKVEEIFVPELSIVNIVYLLLKEMRKNVSTSLLFFIGAEGRERSRLWCSLTFFWEVSFFSL